MPQDNRPTDDSGPAPPGEPGHHDSAATKPPNTASVNSGTDMVAWLRLRRAASSLRLPDPWQPEHITAVQAQGAIDAAHHLLDAGLPPLFDTDTITAIERCDQKLAQRLYDLAGGDFA